MSATSSGIILMICAIFCFSAMDVVAKLLTGLADPLVAVWARYLGQSVLVTLLVLPRLRQVLHTDYPWLQLVRALFLMTATGIFYTSFRVLPLTEVTALIQIAPILITVGAAIFLGEKLGWRRISAIGVALVGAMILLQPGSGVFQPIAILPLIGAACYAGYTLVTRHIGAAEDPMTSLLYTALVALALATLALPLRWEAPEPQAWPLLGLLAVFGSTGQYLLICALSRAEAGLLAPFGYSGMLFATFWGWAIFDETLEPHILLGAVVIVGAGLYVWHRESRDRRLLRP